MLVVLLVASYLPSFLPLLADGQLAVVICSMPTNVLELAWQGVTELIRGAKKAMQAADPHTAVSKAMLRHKLRKKYLHLREKLPKESRLPGEFRSHVCQAQISFKTLPSI